MPSTAGERVEREEKTDNTRWCIAQDTAFEIALATIPYPPNHTHVVSSEAEERWLEAVASTVPGKTAAQVKLRYDMLVEDVKAIEDGRVTTPPQWDDEQLSSSSFSCRSGGDEEGRKKRRGGEVGEMDRRKGMPWTEQEHSSFLLGLKRYGKGDWRSISRFCVVSRTPTQVASHAQKFFIRQNSMNSDRRRSSIHDVKNVSGPANVDSVIGFSLNHQTYPNMPTPIILGAPMVHLNCYDHYFPECGNAYQERNVGTMRDSNIFSCAYSGRPSSRH